MGASNNRLYGVIAILLSFIVSVVAGILKRAGGASWPDTLLFGGQAFFSVVLIFIALFGALQLTRSDSSDGAPPGGR